VLTDTGLGGLMVVPCLVCRDMVHVAAGYYVRHGVYHHGVFSICAGSSTPYCLAADSCCSI